MGACGWWARLLEGRRGRRREGRRRRTGTGDSGGDDADIPPAVIARLDAAGLVAARLVAARLGVAQLVLLGPQIAVKAAVERVAASTFPKVLRGGGAFIDACEVAHA